MWCFCVGKCVGKTPLLILRSLGIFVLRFCRFMSALSVVLRLLVTVSGLAKVAIFTTNVDAENQILINHKCVCGALNRHFCQTRVSGSVFLFHSFFRFYLFVIPKLLCREVKRPVTLSLFFN